ncbi:hypothetical protein PACTADRAFT_4257 [Pachysolen tannophilus NRRL Y-2460]|uniref:U3 small nucleolar RNA-associated protein 22 n=1 Tax=Pachysolen tannophilus NRRL Y-2460 TaxID=669874 RepID=A0A1E4TRF5_PACTA|nr:hypothetical protein PACTADRAFT_4257 [Pachysolen tannophilus NRRL Y-2460]
MVKRSRGGEVLSQEINGVESFEVESRKDEKKDNNEDISSASSFEQENEVDDTAPPNTKRQKQQLSAQDVQVARETAELFKSNIFKLQIDELIKELKLKDSHVSLIEKVLHRLYDVIQQIPEIKDLSLEHVETYLKNSKVSVPFPDPKPTKLNYQFSYLKPEEVSLVGSFGLKTGITTPKGVTVDIALTMPKSIFQQKDYLNYRCLYKRSFYLSYLCEHLHSLSKKNHLPIKISYEYVNGDVLCPALKIVSVDTQNEDDLIFAKTKSSIRLIVGFPFGIFDTKKLLPDRNCIRVQTSDDSKNLPPTPLYNSSILSSTSYEYYLKYLYTTKKTTEAFKDASILGKLWLQQRGFSSSFADGGFGHFEFAILMSALLQGGGVNGNKILLHGFSSYQLFKATIKYLATQDLSEEGYLSFNSLIVETNGAFYKKNGFNVPTIFDKNTKINILWKMTKSSYEILKKYASESLLLLNDVVRDRFESIFLENISSDLFKYDLVIKCPLNQFLENENFGPLEKISFLTFENYIKNKVYVVLRKALGDRVKQISVNLEKNDNIFSVSRRKPNSNLETNSLVVGLYLNPLECEKLITKGPNNDDQEACLKFKSFWGQRASLRKFKDGVIQLCCLWESSFEQPIIVEIIKYIFKLHLCNNEKDIDVKTSVNELQKFLPQPLLPASSKQSILSLHSYQSLNASYESLTKLLMNLELPLKIRSFSPISPALRYTSLLQPVPFAYSNPDFYNEVILQFESSTKWPDELIALEKTKTAFLLKINELLNNETNYKSNLTTFNKIQFNDSATSLTILTPEGYGFKIRILTERDEILYLRAIENSTERQKQILKKVYLEFVRNYMGAIKHHRTFQTLSHHYVFYSASVRLFKKWLDSQLLLVHFSDELIELIAIKVFVDPAPYSVPSSVESGFLRILQFLSRWNWKEDALILDLVKGKIDPEEDEDQMTNKLSDRLTIQSYQLINSNFEKLRQQDPSGSKLQFFIGSKDDYSGILWSNEHSLPLSVRLTALSRAAINILKQNGLNSETIKLLFTPALNDYDFIINLKLPFKLDSSSGILPQNSFKNLIQLTSFPEEIISDPLSKLLEELNKYFKDSIIFSSSKFTGLNPSGDENIISGLFYPGITTGTKKFKVNLGFNLKPSNEEDKVEFNKEAVITEIFRLGGDLIQGMNFKP